MGKGSSQRVQQVRGVGSDVGTFKGRSGETTDFPDDLSEAAVAHGIRDKENAAYKRGSTLENGRNMITQRATICRKHIEPA
ncbi:hypothetical protein C1926_05540 [Stenotrophomonas sp. ZAC14A_NAIMI4_1]|nr:hypothetical protein C1926_05540 [Stenotrophomonas sp. ZAC14A_NAIMI4_1]